MINRNIGMVKTRHGLQVVPKICLSCKVGNAQCKDPHIWPILNITIAHNLMYYFNKSQLFCTHEQSASGKRSGIVC